MFTLYIANAFTQSDFGGNPAAVVPLGTWLSERTMQSMAAQHNLAETAFVVPEGEDFRIRWFTPTVEVDLCGHATLAAAHIYFEYMGYRGPVIRFQSNSGLLSASRDARGAITLDFPVNRPEKTELLPLVTEALEAKPRELFRSAFDYMAVFDRQADIEKLSPDFRKLSQLKARGLIVTARGTQSDFVARCFFPQSGIDEDPVTGSAYTVLAPYWEGQLNKSSFSAIQLSARRGEVECTCNGERVLITGYAKTYLRGEIFL